MTNDFTNNPDGEELEEAVDDEEATLADDLLDEIDDADSDDLLEGFGVLPDATTSDDEEEEEEDEEDEFDDEESLEDDAEDVAFDSFDDIDEM